MIVKRGLGIGKLYVTKLYYTLVMNLGYSIEHLIMLIYSIMLFYLTVLIYLKVMSVK